MLGLKLGRVVIDAGHGGHDVGTHGPSGLLEKDVVLDVALRLGALLEERLGTEVVYTRTDDTYIPLEERTQIANDHKADLFLSIHANSSPYRDGGRRGDVLSELHHLQDRAGSGGAGRMRRSQSSIFDLKDLLAKIAHEGQDRRIARVRFAACRPRCIALSAKSNAGGEESGHQEGSLRGADRSVDAERAGRDRVPDQCRR